MLGDSSRSFEVQVQLWGLVCVSVFGTPRPQALKTLKP